MKRTISSPFVLNLVLRLVSLILLCSVAGIFMLCGTGLGWTESIQIAVASVCLSPVDIQSVQAPEQLVSIMVLMSAGGLLMLYFFVRVVVAAVAGNAESALAQHGWGCLKPSNKVQLLWMFMIMAVIPLLGAAVVFPFWNPQHSWGPGEQWVNSLYVSISSWYASGIHSSLLSLQVHDDLIVRGFAMVMTGVGSLGMLTLLDLFHVSALRARMKDTSLRLHPVSRTALYSSAALLVSLGIYFFFFQEVRAGMSLFGQIMSAADSAAGVFAGTGEALEAMPVPVLWLGMIMASAVATGGNGSGSGFILLPGRTRWYILTTLVFVAFAIGHAGFAQTAGSYLSAFCSAGHIAVDDMSPAILITMVCGRVGTFVVWYVVAFEVFGASANRKR